ncbi:tail fiber protein [Pseudomonas sp. SWRI74]|uniref:Tail fiber protein n=1 Tax=Pseudomonas azerbaijanoccidentalis TaxID=2842347 RepID=A0ABS6QPK7_9PSED|nr:tail fiber protein [Pseudomonas azerbaijanoccidentalis]
MNKVPPGFLERDGSVKSVAAYPDLSAFLDGAFNKGDEGAGNFRLPESRGEFERGWDHGRGVDVGRAVGSAQIGSYLPGDNNAADENIYVHNSGDKAGLGWDAFTGAPAPGTVRYTSASGASTADPVPIALHGGAARPRNIAVVMCIKAWNAPINQGNIDIAALVALAAQATETNQGTAKIATQALTNAGVDDTTIVTPKKMRWGFGISLAANGYITFPTWLGGLILQWGQIQVGDIANAAAVPYSLPLAFPNAHYQTLLSCGETGAGQWNVYLISKSLLGFSWAANEFAAVVQNAKVTYLSIGS